MDETLDGAFPELQFQDFKARELVVKGRIPDVRKPLDLETDVAWVGYANARLRERVEPALRGALERRGLVVAASQGAPDAERNTQRIADTFRKACDIAEEFGERLAAMLERYGALRDASWRLSSRELELHSRLGLSVAQARLGRLAGAHRVDRPVGHARRRRRAGSEAGSFEVRRQAPEAVGKKSGTCHAA